MGLEVRTDWSSPKEESVADYKVGLGLKKNVLISSSLKQFIIDHK